jgi:lysophospholipid acyltransferase (LPLAT)-like uncharacterized protein
MSSASSSVATGSVAPRRFSLRERVLLRIIAGAGYGAIRLLTPTLRLYESFEEGARSREPQHATIYAFWHRCTFMAAWCMRNEQGAIMVSQSFDGEYIARIVERLGYVAVRGSSSRGGVVALREMHDHVRQGHSAAFTADGPRGPKYIAKPGALILARNTGAPIVAFHVALQDPITLRSWDRFMIPKPFSVGVIRGSRPLFVPREADDVEMKRLQTELQAMMDRTRIAAERLLETGEYRRLIRHDWGRVRERWINPDQSPAGKTKKDS